MSNAMPMPNGLTKEAIIQLLLQEEYGFLPPPAPISARVAMGLPVAVGQLTPVLGAVSASGYVGYHRRAGRHYFSREDWRLLLDWLEASWSEKGSDVQ